ncbi:CS1 type fimbrial major subunit [Pseudomonas sp. NPDC089554]|uniref:CS1 type fimbrial major subunit n=1 Tax=Pseudomonas sp. NPDC089554 TaxID=3390653 RepID=UPI003D074A62
MKRLFMALPLALFTATAAHAADPIEKQVQVTAQVPTDAFYVEPVGGNWMNDPQELQWNSFRSELQPIRKQLQVKSTVGPIAAYMLSPATITSGLDVKVANEVLTTTSAEVVSGALAGPGAVIGFEIAAQAAPSTGYVPGNYQGLVSMMFETNP